MSGGRGNDVIDGGAGRRLAVRRAGNDTSTAARAATRSTGGTGGAAIDGEGGDDWIATGPGSDKLTAATATT